MFQKMKAIEYNTLMTLLYTLGVSIELHVAEYGMTGQIDVIPSYPRDISKLRKPSIIVRKVGGVQAPIGFGSFLGQFFNADDSALYDVNGTSYDSTIQLDVCTDDNGSNLMIISLLTDEIFIKTHELKLYDFTADINAPVEMGVIKLLGEVSVTSVEESNLNNDYISAVRFDINVIQATIPDQEFVDLSKWLKQSYKITL